MLTLTDTQAAWLRRSGETRCVLAGPTYFGDNGAGAGEEFTFYCSTHPYVTGTSGTLRNQIFRQCIVRAPDLTRRLSDSLIGRGQTTIGDLIIDSKNLRHNDLMFWNWIGRRLWLRIGSPDWAFDDFILYLAEGRTADVYDATDGQGQKIGFKISDKSLLLQQPIIPDGALLAGGATNATNTPIPRGGEDSCLALGYLCENVLCKAVDDVNHEFEWTLADAGNPPWTSYDLPANPVDVRVRGVSLKVTSVVGSFDAGSDLVHWEGHGLAVGARVSFIGIPGDEQPPAPLVSSPTGSASTYYWVSSSSHGVNSFRLAATLEDALAGLFINLTASQPQPVRIESYFWTNTTRGRFRLATRPDGDVTADVYGLAIGDPPGSTRVVSGGDIVEFIATSDLIRRDNVLTMSDIDSDSLDAFKAAAPQAQAFYVSRRTTIGEILDKVCSSVGFAYIFNRAGQLIFVDMSAFGEGSPAYIFRNDDAKVRGVRLVRRIPPKIDVKVAGRKNNYQQQNLAESLPEFRRDQYSRPHVVKTGIVVPGGDWWTDPNIYLNATRDPPLETLLCDDDDIQARATEVGYQYVVPNGAWGIDVPHKAVLMLDPGDTAGMEYAKIGGRGTVVATIDRPGKGGCEVQICMPLAPSFPVTDNPPPGTHDDDLFVRTVAFSGAGSVSWVDGTDVIVDEYTAAAGSHISSVSNFHSSLTGQSFTGTAKTITQARFYLGNVGGATGSAYARLYAHSGNFGLQQSLPTGSPLATSDALDVSTITADPSNGETIFTFTTGYLMAAGTKYVIALTFPGGAGGGSPKYLRVMGDGSGVAPGNASSDGTYFTGNDLWYRVFGI